MILEELTVQNFRGIRDTTIPLSSFVCLIGENNAGKSSLLLALRLFQSGSSLPKTDYFDEGQEIRIMLRLAEIGDADLLRIAPEHRDRIAEIIHDGTLKLVRIYGSDGKSKLNFRAVVPKDDRFSPQSVAELVAKQKPGTAFKERIVDQFPELDGQVDNTTNQATAKVLIQQLVDGMPPDQMTEEDRPLPTGIDSSVKSLLPEPIYIPAVKDLSDDTKTKETATFGKVLGILLDQITDKLEDADQLFERLNKQLNLIANNDGTVTDHRLEEVRDIESTVERFIQESFSSVKVRIRIPPPEIKTVLQNAQIYANDGVDGLIETKGDGLRRAMVFSILRSYVELRQKHEAAQLAVDTRDDAGSKVCPPPTQYLLLFEEPELYLHPQAQLVLFDALGQFARQHTVVTTTHSPAFFGPDATKTFVKLKKVSEVNVPKPFTHAIPIDLSGVSEKDQFQIICYENNNAAFFADHVILVEGPSDFLVMPHIASLLNPEWNPARSPVRFARVGGKSSIRKYRDFFGRFGTTVSVVADLDVILDGFDQLGAGDELSRLRAEMLQDLDAALAASGEDGELSQKQAKDLQSKGEAKAKWKAMRKAYSDAKEGRIPIEQAHALAEEFFAYERKNERLHILQDSSDTAITEKKNKILSGLRDRSVYALSRGAVEDYYPDTICGGDKASRAQSFCRAITAKDDLLTCCDALPDGKGGQRPELEIIFDSIFRGSPPQSNDTMTMAPETRTAAASSAAEAGSA